LRPLTGQETALCVIGVIFFFYATATVYLFLSIRCFPRKPVMSEMDEQTRMQMEDIYPKIYPIEPVDVVYDRTPIDSRRPGRISGSRLGDLAMAKSLRGTQAEPLIKEGAEDAGVGARLPGTKLTPMDTSASAYVGEYTGTAADLGIDSKKGKMAGTYAYWNNENVA
jgi:hypothetical protein